MSTHSVSALEDSLFAEWRQTVPTLVTDGVISEPDFLASARRLVFVLKEVNDRRDGGRWDLREYVRSGASTTLWTRVARWVHAIRRLPSELSWSDIAALGDADRASALQSICAMNLKKSPGSYVAVASELDAASKRDASLLIRQRTLYSPATFIWCGVDPVQLHEAPLEWKKTTRGIPFSRAQDGSLIIRYVHPTARVPDHLIHFGLVDAIREVDARAA